MSYGGEALSTLFSLEFDYVILPQGGSWAESSQFPVFSYQAEQSYLQVYEGWPHKEGKSFSFQILGWWCQKSQQ